MGSDYATSNSAIAVDANLRNPRHVIISSFGENRWKRIWDVPDKACIGRLSFLTNEMLAYACRRVSVISTDGKILFKAPLEKDEALGASSKISVSQDGNILTLSVEVAHDFWDTGGRLAALRVAVYSTVTKSRILTVNVSPLPKVVVDFALSPDGSRLAVLNDRNISMYPIPPS